MDLSPRTAPGEAAAVDPRGRRSPWVYGALVLVLIGIAVVAFQALTSASLYFYNADEVVEQRLQLGDRRIQVQGLVRDDVRRAADGVTFTLTFNGVDLAVRHQGDPPELFEPGIPAVLEGRWAADGSRFDSDRILVKHSEEYEADNQGRIDDARDATSGETSTP